MCEHHVHKHASCHLRGSCTPNQPIPAHDHRTYHFQSTDITIYKQINKPLHSKGSQPRFLLIEFCFVQAAHRTCYIWLDQCLMSIVLQLTTYNPKQNFISNRLISTYNQKYFPFRLIVGVDLSALCP